MARTASETARILSEIFHLRFAQDFSEPFRMTWSQLRLLAGVPRLLDDFLKEIDSELSEHGNSLISMDNYLLIVGENDLDHYRMLPDKLLETYLPDGVEQNAHNDDQELEEDDD